MTTKEKINDYEDRLLRHLAAARDYPEAHRNIDEPTPIELAPDLPISTNIVNRVKREFNRSF